MTRDDRDDGARGKTNIVMNMVAVDGAASFLSIHIATLTLSH